MRAAHARRWLTALQGVARRRAEFESARVRFLARSPDVAAQPFSDSAHQPSDAAAARRRRSWRRARLINGRARRDVPAVFRAACRGLTLAEAGVAGGGGGREGEDKARSGEAWGEDGEERLGAEQVAGAAIGEVGQISPRSC
jgi:hypothetical protein